MVVGRKNLQVMMINKDYGDEVNTALNHVTGDNPQDQWLAMFKGEAYAYRNGGWRLLYDGDIEKVKTAMKNSLNAYETGGLADFTGPAWLDGTKSHPELVLNARDTQNFIQLKDILAEVMSDKNISANNQKTSGDNYYEIQINVDEFSSDYDVEQMAQKIRSMLYEDASYRNVNAISRIR